MAATEPVAVLRKIVVSSAVVGSLLAGSVVNAHTEGRALEPPRYDQELYDLGPPELEEIESPLDGVKLVAEVWRPRQKAGGVEPEKRLPVVLTIGPYTTAQRTIPFNHSPLQFRDFIVKRAGYAFVFAASRGTGLSGGCLDLWGSRDAADGSALVEWAGTQPWSDGNVGMYGLSGSGFPIWTTALGGDRERLGHLKAIVPISASPSLYPAANMDGVAGVPRNLAIHGVVFPSHGFHLRTETFTGADSRLVAERLCEPGAGTEHTVASADSSGNFTPYWRDREHRDGVAEIRAATLVAHGIHDANLLLGGYMGLLDRWPEKTPLKVMLGQYRHGPPDSGDMNPHHARADWLHWATAWFDRWLKGTKNGADDWPAVQVQDARNQWREEQRWIGGDRDGALALSADAGGGVLGAKEPSGSTVYRQGAAQASPATTTFTTPPLEDDLRIYGDVQLDLWVKVSNPEAKVAVHLAVLDPLGNVQTLQTNPNCFPSATPLCTPYSEVVGARSMRHLEPFVDGRFEQEEPADHPALSDPIHTTVRLMPTEMLVPKGWRLRLAFFGGTGSNEPARYSGGAPLPPETVSPEGAHDSIEILHDCVHPTVLRFAMADPNAVLLDIRDRHEGDAPLQSSPQTGKLSVNGGGIATRSICAGRPTSSAAPPPSLLP